MSLRKGDRVLHRGMGAVGVVTSEARAGQIEVRTSDGRLELWPMNDTLLHETGADDPFQPGHGHVSDPHGQKLAGARPRVAEDRSAK